MTPHEIQIIRKCLENYPANQGITNWGYGPLKRKSYIEIISDKNKKIIKKYG